MKTLTFYLLLAICPIVASAQSKPVTDSISNSDSIREEYLTIVIKNYFLNTKAYISINGDSFKTINLKTTGQFYNFNDALNLMKGFNKDGWELKSGAPASSSDGLDGLFIIMTRRKIVGKKPDVANL